MPQPNAERTEPAGDPAAARTAKVRRPNFFIIGTAKGGTTTLFQFLAPHPEVFLPESKELHYFDRDYENGLDWYLSHFADARDEKAVGEATPQYMLLPETRRRMWDFAPDAKLVAILRHPVERAYSHYWMQRSKFTSRHSFQEVLRMELRDRSVPHGHALYIEAGYYLEQLKGICELYPRERLLVFLMEDLSADPHGTVRTLYRFLGIDETFEPPDIGTAFNATTRLRSERLRRLMLRVHAARRFPRLAPFLDRLNRAPGYPPLDAKTRAELLALYRPHNAALAEWLARDLSDWDR